MNRNLIIIVTILLLNILLGGLCLVLARRVRQPQALRLWGAGLLVYALGLIVVLSGLVLPKPLTAFAGNALIVWAPVLAVRGVLSHTRLQFDPRWLWPGVAITVAALAYNNFVLNAGFLGNALPPTVLAILLFSLGAVLLLRAPPLDARIEARFVAVVMLLAVLLWCYRLLFLAGAVGPADSPDRADLTAAMLGVAQIMVTVACTFALFAVEVHKKETALSQLAFCDSLTGLPNRRAALARFGEESARAERRGQIFALLMIDIDHFKAVNDQHGHLTGDAMLKHVATTLAEHKRQEDFLARIGGEEFMLLLFDPDPDGAVGAALRLLHKIEAASLHDHDHTLAVTISGGIAFYPHDGRDWDALFAAADRRLYSSKQAGRNRVTGPESTP